MVRQLRVDARCVLRELRGVQRHIGSAVAHAGRDGQTRMANQVDSGHALQRHGKRKQHHHLGGLFYRTQCITGEAAQAALHVARHGPGGQGNGKRG
jgi:hypothetical protein